MDEAQRRAVLVRAKAREFAALVRSCPGWACSVPEEIVDWLRDSEFPAFFEHCRSFRITRRDDMKWEATL